MRFMKFEGLMFVVMLKDFSMRFMSFEGLMFVVMLLVAACLNASFNQPPGPFEVTDAQGNPLSTGMSWHMTSYRLTDEEVLASSLAPTIEALRDEPFISPDMVGDDGADDDTELVRWSILVARVLKVPLHINKAYGISGPIEIQQGQTWFGNGPESPGLYHLVDSIASKDLGVWRAHSPAIVHSPNTKQCSIRDLQIDGRQSEVDWQAVRAWDQADQSLLGNHLGDSVSWSGIAFTNHGGRPLLERAYIDRVHSHDTLSSCMLAQCEVQGGGIRLGNSVGGRPLYDMIGGSINGLDLYGFTRSSICRIRPPTVINGFKYRGHGYANPWPENTHGDNLGALYEKSGDTGIIVINNLDVDGSDSEINRSFDIEASCRITGSMRNLQRIWKQGDQPIRPMVAEIQLKTENCQAPQVFRGFRHLKLHWVNTFTDPPANPVQSLAVEVKKKPGWPADDRQSFDIFADPGAPVHVLVHFKDLVLNDVYPNANEVVPTTVQLSGRFDQIQHRWVSFRPGATDQRKGQEPMGWLETMPIELIIENVECDTEGSGDASWETDGAILNVWSHRELIE